MKIAFLSIQHTEQWALLTVNGHFTLHSATHTGLSHSPVHVVLSDASSSLSRESFHLLFGYSLFMCDNIS